MTRASNLAIFAANPPTTNSTALSVSGNLVFSSTGKRITGDFSNATQANRVAFQTSTTNGTSALTVIPNGTSTQSSINLFDNSDPTNAGTLNFVSNSTEKSVRSAITGTGTYLPMTFYTNGSERARIATTGLVSVGRTGGFTGSETFTVNGFGTFGSDTAPQVIVGHTGTGYGVIGTYSNYPLEFRVNNTGSMYIDTSGNVGIGTSSPARKFDVVGGARFLQDTSATTGAIVLRQNSGDTVGGYIQWVNNGNSAEKGWLVVDTSSNMAFATGSTERVRITSAGGFSVGTTANPGAGAIYATGNITAYYSDERLKENITPINNALTKVNSITGVTYNSNDLAAEYGFTDRSQQVGVLAQEIQRILPEAVKHAPFDMADAEDGTPYSKSGETYLTVQYDKLVPLLIEAIKELTARVEELESR